MGKLKFKRVSGQGVDIGGARVMVDSIRTNFRGGSGAPVVELLVEAPEEIPVNRCEREVVEPNRATVKRLLGVGFQLRSTLDPDFVLLILKSGSREIFIEAPATGQQAEPTRWWLDRSQLSIPKGGLTMARVNQLFILIGRSLRK